MTTAGWSLRCEGCGRRFAAFAASQGCPDCRAQGRHTALAVEGRLPGAGDPGAVSLGEGGTPLLPAGRLGAALGMPHLHLKIEGANPTGSYKDRYVAATLNAVLPFGIDRIVVSSTGNLGVSGAAYAAAAGLHCLFLAAAGLPASALAQAQAHGARVVLADPARRQALFEHAALQRGWFPIGLRMPRAVANPFGVEGYRAIAGELTAALGRPPDAVLFPCARGNGLHGTWLGFRDRPGPRPRMIACQPAQANSLEASLEAGCEVPLELPAAGSVAFSTCERQSDAMALRAIRESGGSAVSADDAAILAAQARLAAAGVFVEASSALPLACLPRLLAEGVVRPDDTVVCLLTAGGIRWTEHLPAADAVPQVEGTTALDRYLDGTFG